MTEDLTTRRRNWSLALLFAAYALNICDRQIINILGQDIKTEMRISDMQLGMLTGTAFGIFYSILGMPLGRLADRINRVRLISVALAIWSGFTAVSGMAGSYVHLFVARIGVGVGEAGCLPASTSLIHDLFTEGRRTSAMSVMLFGATVGSFFGLFVGGYLASRWGWHAAFIVAGAPGFLLASVMAITMKDPRPAFQPHILQVQPAKGNAPSVIATLLMLARRPGFMWIMFGGMCAVFLVYVSGAWLPPFFIRVYGMNTAAIGRYAAVSVGVGGAIGTLGAGSLCDLLRKRFRDVESKVMIVSLGLTAPTLLATVLSQDRSLALVSMFLFNVFAYAFLAPTVRLTQRAATPETIGLAVAAGTLATIPNLAFGLPLVGAISDMLTPKFGHDAIRYALAICATAGVLGAIAHWRALKGLRASSLETGGS